MLPPQPILSCHEADGPSSEHIITAPVSSPVTITMNGERFRIVPPDPPTYRIAEITATHGDLYHCRMEGSDGSHLEFFLSTADLEHNLSLAANHIPCVGKIS